MKINIEELESAYGAASKGSDAPNFAILQVPGLGAVTLTKQATYVNGLAATPDQIESVKAFLCTPLP